MKNLKISLGLIILCIFGLSIFNCSDSGKNLNDIWVSVDKNNITTTILDMKDKEILKSTSFILGVLMEDEHKYTIEKTGDIFILKAEKGKFSSYNGNIKFVNDTMFLFNDSIKYYKCPEYSELISGLYNFYVNSTKVDLYIDVNSANNLVFSNKGQKNEKKFSITGNVLSIIEESGKNMNFLILDETHMAAMINPLEGGIIFEAVKEGSHPYGLQSSFGNLQEERSYNSEFSSNLNTPDGVVVKFINSLGSQDFSSAYYLMTEKRRGSYSLFSSTRAYGGITSTKIFECSYEGETNGKKEVLVDYESIDPANKSGRFKQYFYLIPSGNSYLISDIKNINIDWY